MTKRKPKPCPGALTTGSIMSSCNHIFNNTACINLGFPVQACESLGPVDILINCAGFAVCGLFEETTVDQFKVNIHLFYCSFSLPQLKKIVT